MALKKNEYTTAQWNCPKAFAPQDIIIPFLQKLQIPLSPQIQQALRHEENIAYYPFPGSG